MCLCGDPRCSQSLLHRLGYQVASSSSAAPVITHPQWCAMGRHLAVRHGLASDQLTSWPRRPILCANHARLFALTADTLQCVEIQPMLRRRNRIDAPAAVSVNAAETIATATGTDGAAYAGQHTSSNPWVLAAAAAALRDQSDSATHAVESTVHTNVVSRGEADAVPPLETVRTLDFIGHGPGGPTVVCGHESGLLSLWRLDHDGSVVHHEAPVMQLRPHAYAINTLLGFERRLARISIPNLVSEASTDADADSNVYEGYVLTGCKDGTIGLLGWQGWRGALGQDGAIASAPGMVPAAAAAVAHPDSDPRVAGGAWLHLTLHLNTSAPVLALASTHPHDMIVSDCTCGECAECLLPGHVARVSRVSVFSLSADDVVREWHVPFPVRTHAASPSDVPCVRVVVQVESPRWLGLISTSHGLCLVTASATRSTNQVKVWLADTSPAQLACVLPMNGMRVLGVAVLKSSMLSTSGCVYLAVLTAATLTWWAVGPSVVVSDVLTDLSASFERLRAKYTHHFTTPLPSSSPSKSGALWTCTLLQQYNIPDSARPLELLTMGGGSDVLMVCQENAEVSIRGWTGM
jgi:hypothetical protein